MNNFNIRIPASTANIGPGFDSLGIALALYLDIHVILDPQSLPNTPTRSIMHPHITLSYDDLHQDISLLAESNLITKVALFVCQKSNKTLPTMHVHCINRIPFGSGMGSSASAIVAGVMIANRACHLDLTSFEILSFCLDFENHPDVLLLLNPSFIHGVMESSFIHDLIEFCLIIICSFYY